MRTPFLFSLALAIVVSSCVSAGESPAPGGPPEGRGTPPASSGAPRRIPAVDRKDPLHGRVEGETLDNRCADDSRCRVGGCSGEVCSAAGDVMTSCEIRPWPQGKSKCGCVKGECVWYREEAPGAGALLDGQGQSCRRSACPPPMTCLSYLGVGGGAGPPLDSCEIPCSAPGSACPPGQACITVADGPGRVCRPSPVDGGAAPG